VVDVIGVSIDGPTEAANSEMRGPGASLSEALDFARFAISRGTQVKIMTVVSAANQEAVQAMAGLIRDLQPSVWRVYQYSGRGTENSGHARHAISSQQFLSVVDALRSELPTVPIAPSTDLETGGCLIVGVDGEVLQPTTYGYRSLGSVFESAIDSLWS